MIPYGKQNISGDDIEAVVEVLKSDFLTQGPVVPLFEKKVKEYVGVPYAYAVSSATAGLHIACLSLGVGPGDLVWTSPISFVASANCALYCGAQIDFVDIDPISYNMSVPSLETKLALAEKSGKLPKVVIPVHLAGQSCDMLEIRRLSEKYGFRVIEDASHAIGGEFKSSKIGSCEYSDITVFSFHPVKIITTGEGGMVTTKDANLAEKLYRLRSHGITRDPKEMTTQPDGSWYYQQIELGYNYRLTDIQAALGYSQMNRLDIFVNKRHEIFQKYSELLSDIDIVKPCLNEEGKSSLHLYIIRLRQNNKLKISRNELFERLRLGGVFVNIHYIPIYRQPFFSQFHFNWDDFPESEKYYSESITLPMYPDLTYSDLEYIKKCLITPIGHQTLF
ncbi:UDP-4-amino-4,6-dideoxy-N-acetyl-beta-L-altrosamine transaminase [Leptospira jelokensis]|uniref:UDP-4-amino-4, 6-dideoxy-N-acetyl-beta-L-altrosamine transaminase n=1 Tax=Leptospira jelokensis TaxID=2484931 RepID=UPI0010918160|nr:UDP-4-amino-4,6-dideoxy-N-acetyl-beta-L-altrosamine transaminase [Leptospira jelokensis]TGL99211.1 UDP-4-amino-4,6-dideoxy-N-acetyl-beta-L-altrosamine transaminase [Leptospira jelokensis]